MNRSAEISQFCKTFDFMDGMMAWFNKMGYQKQFCYWIIFSLLFWSCENNDEAIDPELCQLISSFTVSQKSDKPIFNLSSNWNYASVVDPTVVEIDGNYHMWYTGRGNSKFQVGYAISKDGENWFEYSKNPVLKVGRIGDFDEDHLRRPYVIYDEGVFKMWYSGYGKKDSDDLHYAIGYAESHDGIDWTKYNNNPIVDVSESGWDDIDILLGSVVKKENKYYLWYDGLSSSHPENIDWNNSNNIADGGLATSSDGVNWSKNPSPVFTSSKKGFESNTIDVRGVNWNKNGGFFEMLYSGKELGNSGYYYRSIGRATSEDGINWVKDGFNPIITYGSQEDWNRYSTAAGVFIRNGDDYMVWFSGVGRGSQWNIGFIRGKVACL